MKKFNWKITLIKAIKAALAAFLVGAGSTTILDNVDTSDKAILTAVITLGAAALEALRNWLKHR